MGPRLKVKATNLILADFLGLFLDKDWNGTQQGTWNGTQRALKLVPKGT